MLFLSREQYNVLIGHSREEAPNEACGILAGRGKKVSGIFRMTNTDKSPQTFFMDPEEQLEVIKRIRNSGLEMVGIYHSHLESEAYPSRRDIELAYYPEASYLIISLKDRKNPKLRSFKITAREVVEERIEIE